MYLRNRFRSSSHLKMTMLHRAIVPLFQVFLIFFPFFALQAFVQADLEPHPYENNRFLNAYATLQQPSAQVFENISLRDALKNIQSSSGVTIWLDRRIDGEQLIQVNPGKRSHFECLTKLCQQTDTETAWLENILYIAPTHQSAKIENAFWELFTHRGNDYWRKQGKTIMWGDPTEVHWILEKGVRSVPFKLQGLESLEHDIWSKASIPETSIAAQWSCLLAGFGRTIKLDEQQRWNVVELPAESNVAFMYVKQLGKIGPTRLEEWRLKWPAAKVAKQRNGSMSITAPVAAHRDLMAATIKIKVAPSDLGGSWSLEYKGELGSLLKTLSIQLDLKIIPSPLPKALAAKQIEIKVKEASIDNLLQEVTKQSGIPCTRQGNKVTLQIP